MTVNTGNFPMKAKQGGFLKNRFLRAVVDTGKEVVSGGVARTATYNPKESGRKKTSTGFTTVKKTIKQGVTDRNKALRDLGAY